MNDAYALPAFTTRFGEESAYRFTGLPLVESVQIRFGFGMKFAAPQAAQHAGVRTFTQKEQFLAGFKFRRIWIVCQAFGEYPRLVFAAEAWYRARTAAILCAFDSLNRPHIAHGFAERLQVVVGDDFILTVLRL